MVTASSVNCHEAFADASNAVEALPRGKDTSPLTHPGPNGFSAVDVLAHEVCFTAKQPRSGDPVSYRNKTYVAFASEDIKSYWLMEAWRENKNIDFSFFDAHDLYVARDSSKPETIKGRLRERMKNAKQFVLLGSAVGKRKGSNGTSFLAYEVQNMLALNLPIVVANLDGDRTVVRNFIPRPLLEADYYTLSVSFQPSIIKYALDEYAPAFATSQKSKPHEYKPEVYKRLGL